MNHTQQRTRRPAAAMGGHAYMLSWRHHRSDENDAHRMAVFMRLREAVNSRARMLILSGLAGGQS